MYTQAFTNQGEQKDSVGEVHQGFDGPQETEKEGVSGLCKETETVIVRVCTPRWPSAGPEKEFVRHSCQGRRDYDQQQRKQKEQRQGISLTYKKAIHCFFCSTKQDTSN